MWGENGNARRVLAGKPKVKRPFGRPRHRCEDNISIELIEIGWNCVNWIQLAQDRKCGRMW
jgi:hypothetical protein